MTGIDILEWVKLIIGGILVLVIPVMVYFIKNEIRNAGTELWEKVFIEINRHYSLAQEETKLLHSRVETLKETDSALYSKQALFDLEIRHISQKLDSIDKKLDTLGAR